MRSKVLEAASKQETPFFWYDLDLLEKTLEDCFQSAKVFGFHVHYALKANFNRPILEKIRMKGLGADCVSGGEIKLALEIGFPPGDIVFAGVGKTDKEILFALENEIFCFNVESIQELEVIEALAKKLNRQAPIALRLNPNVDAGTHHYITTGLSENKFGIHLQQLNEIIKILKNSNHLSFKGLHFHIGSSIVDMEIFRTLCLKVNEVVEYFENEGFQIHILNLGGGLGIDYHTPNNHPIPDFPSYFEIFDRFLTRKKSREIHFELGRSLVAQCGSLITRVLYNKKGIKTDFLIVDAGMNDLIRPSLYQAYHHIENLSHSPDKTPSFQYDVVGPVCESGDFFRKSADLPETFRGDLLAIRSTGAYGEVMSSPYNLREKAAVIYFSSDLKPHELI